MALLADALTESVHRPTAVADTVLHPEIRRVVRDLSGEPAGQRRPEPASMVDAVAELAACFPVYRSYLPAGRADLDHAFAEARRRRPGLAAVLLTGNASGEVEARLALDGMAGGAFSLLRKPVKADELAERVGAVLDRAEQVPSPASSTK